jgi:hypothetical protein
MGRKKVDQFVGNIPTNAKDIFQLSGIQVTENLKAMARTGMAVYYLESAHLTKSFRDYQNEPAKFQDEYQYETWDEWLRETRFINKEDANRVIQDFYFMEYCIQQEISIEKIYQLKKDTLRHLRRYNDWDKVKGNIKKLKEAFEIALTLDNAMEFREWYDEQKAIQSGKKDKDSITPRKLTKTQQKVWAFDESLKTLDEMHKSAQGKRKDAILECLYVLKNKLSEAVDV